MAKVYQIETAGYNQSEFESFAHSFLFAESITPVWTGGSSETAPNTFSLIVTSQVESDDSIGSRYRLLADDSMSEVAVDIATGKFVEGNVICGIAPLHEVQNDVRDFVTYTIDGTDYVMFKGVCSTTQSQDYTPDLVANSRVTKMLTPAQVKSLNL